MVKLRKLIASLVLSVFLFSTVSTSPVFAQEWYLQTLPQWYSKVYDQSNPTEIFGERYTAAQVQWIFYGLMAFFFNTVTNGNTALVECFMQAFGGGAVNINTCVTAAGNIISYEPGTAPVLAETPRDNNLVDQFFADRPLSGVTYFKQLGRKFNLVQDANAQQGFGYNVLRPVEDLWAASRNISYALLIFASIILAFMVMFRVKLSPQVVVTAQSAIPKLMVAIILIAFSYAIAGLLVDLAYVVLAIFAIVLAPNDVGNQFNRMIAGPTTGGLLIDFITYVLVFFVDLVFAWISGVVDTALGGWVVDFAIAMLATGIVGFIAFILVVLLFIVILWIWIKTIFLLFKTLAMLLIKVIIFPFYIILGVIIPGLGVWSWIRGFIADLAVFVVASVLLNLAFFFLAQSAAATWADLGTVPPGWLADVINNVQPLGLSINVNTPTGGTWPPLLGRGLGANLLYLGISLVMIFMIPKSAEIISGLITRRGFAVGTAIGEAMSPVSGAGQFGWGAAKTPVQGGVRDVTSGLVNRATSRFTSGSATTPLKPFK